MRVKRLPSTGETLLATGYRVDYGGKGSNQAVGCARLGAQVSFVASIGADNFGEMALSLYREEAIDVAHIRRTADSSTGVGFIVVEEVSGHNCIVLDPGANDRLTAADLAKCEAAFRSACVVLTQLEIPVEPAAAALQRGRESGAVTILNPAPVRSLPASVLRHVDILTPNETEAKVLTGRGAATAIEPEKLALELIRAGVKNVVMTLGEKGALLVTASSAKHFPALSVAAVDTTGAGDAFNAGLATALAFGATLDEAVQFAVVTGGLAVTKEGVIPSLPRPGDLREFYSRQNCTPPAWLRLRTREASKEATLKIVR